MKLEREGFELWSERSLLSVRVIIILGVRFFIKLLGDNYLEYLFFKIWIFYI